MMPVIGAPSQLRPPLPNRVVHPLDPLGGKLVAAAFTEKRMQALRPDAAAFAEPDRLDLLRAPKAHVAFGAGAHHCLGAQLARMELQEAFRGLLTRLPGLRMAVPLSGIEFREGQAVASMRELPVTWDDPETV